MTTFLFTFNCNRIADPTLLSKVSTILPPELPSLFIFGFQEVCPILDGCFPQVVHPYLLDVNKILVSTLKSTYGDTVRFHTISIVHVGAIALIAITPYKLRVGHVREAVAGCGYFGLSMKGAVGLRLEYSESGTQTEFSFAVAHLAAGEGDHYYDKRNSNLAQLMRSLDFGDSWGLLKPNSHAFVLGDLNYRTAKRHVKSSPLHNTLFSFCDQSRKHPDVAKMVLQHDELTHARTAGDALNGFTEAPIKFVPTYKYVNSSAIYNQNRSPSWCDRILFQSTYSEAPTIIDYNSLTSLLISDHQPVYLVIKVPLQAPESIVSPATGYLQILPSDTVENAAAVSGPTQIYMKPTKLDALMQWVLRPVADRLIGYSLWYSTTSGGRLRLLGFLLVVALGYYLKVQWK